jgi:DNA-binding ferritin-like protein (Dps family)
MFGVGFVGLVVPACGLPAGHPVGAARAELRGGLSAERAVTTSYPAGSLLGPGALEPSVPTDWNLGLDNGTIPSIARLSNGGYEIAFNSFQHELWTVGTAGWTDWHLGMAEYENPAITALPNGGFEVAFVSNLNQLWTVGTDGWRDWGLGVEGNPSITALAGGGFEVAFTSYGYAPNGFGQDSPIASETGQLWTVGTDGWRNWGLRPAPWSTPIVGLAGGGFEVALESIDLANEFQLETVRSAGNTVWPVGMFSGPAIAALPGGGYEVAFESQQRQLWTVGTAGWSNWNLGIIGVPSIVAVPRGGFEVAFTSWGADPFRLWTVGSAGWTDWGNVSSYYAQSMIAMPNGGLKVAVNFDECDEYIDDQHPCGQLWTIG